MMNPTFRLIPLRSGAVPAQSGKPLFDGFMVRNVATDRGAAQREAHREEEAVLLELSRMADRFLEDRPDHAERVSALAYRLALAAGIGEQDALLLRRAARLLDIGFLAIPQTILAKQGPLTDGERESIELHAQCGAAILSRFNSPLARVAQGIAAHHHEWWNGSGYPNGLIEDSIPLAARIVAIADVFDALICQRAGRDALTVEEAVEEISAAAGSQFDPRLVRLFLGLLEQEQAVSGRYNIPDSAKEPATD